MSERSHSILHTKFACQQEISVELVYSWLVAGVGRMSASFLNVGFQRVRLIILMLEQVLHTATFGGLVSTAGILGKSFPAQFFLLAEVKANFWW